MFKLAKEAKRAIQDARLDYSKCAKAWTLRGGKGFVQNSSSKGEKI